ncbi:MAG TPA: hypothetical protein H9865_01600 [Candidatus Fournierella pullicola]|uniref:Uncharacterized protein n=1 Tax=Candidatus Allofournierella pullicola TaxID=2838596 RepID=A0A9D2ADD2_9FIRM|nr:hypothetical protein [Candidatus Fournierella pullicola]
MTEQERMDLPTNEQPAPVSEPAPAAEQAAPAPVPVLPAPPRRPPVRRVGTVTLGLSLIVTGLAITAYFFVPGFDIISVAKLAPLVLVFLGAEVLWASARRKGEERLRLDFLAAFVSFVLICASLCAATLPAVWRWYGPDRSSTEERLSDELEEQLHAAFQGQDVLDCNGWVNLGGYEFDREMTLADLRAEDHAGANITLGGTVANGDEFAARVAALLPALRDAGVDRAYFYWSDDDESWDLDLDGVFDMNADATRLSQMGRHQVQIVDEFGDTMWMEAGEAEEYLARQAAAAAENDGEAGASSAAQDFDGPVVSEETAAGEAA